MALQQSLGLGVEISLQDRFTPVAMKVVASFQQMRTQITQGAQDISRAGQMMGQSMGGAAPALKPAMGKSGGKKGGGSGFSGLQNVIGGVTTAMVALKGVTAGFSAFDGLTEIAGTFDKAVVSAGALMNLGWKQTPKEMKMLENAAIQAGIATQFTPTQAAEGLALLGQSGYNATEATKLLIPTLNLAAAGEISVAQAASTMSAGVKIFGLDISQAAGATDKMLRIANATSLTAGDLQIALGNVSRGAIVTGQSMDEMLPSIGLVKNAGVDASIAASSVSSALLMMAKNSKKFKSELGVNVTDAAGNFRPMMDVIHEADIALQKKFPDSAKRSAKAMELFGKFGLSAFANMSAQMNKGITGEGGKKVTGNDAISFLRKSMANASAGEGGGAANEFKNRLLDTFEGQKILLRGSMETLAITLGQPFTAAMRPIVAGVTDLVNKIITIVQGMSPELKLFLAKFAIGAASFASFATAAIGVGAALSAVAGPVIEVIGALGTLGPIAAGLAVVFGGIATVFAGFKVAFDNDVGGFGSLLRQKFNDAKLIVQGFAQVFTSGQISGPVADELSKTENAGLLAFIGRMYAAFNQVKSFVDSFVTGFKESIKGAEPIFHDLSASVEKLLGNFSGLTAAVDGDQMSSAFAKSDASGKSFGTNIANMVLLVIVGLTKMISFVDGVVSAWDRVSGAFSPILAVFGEFFGFFSEIANEFLSLSAAGEASGSTLTGVGWYIANIWSNVGSVITAALGFAKNMFLGVGNVIVGLGEIIYGVFTLNGTMVWNGFKRVAFGAITAVIGMLGFFGETAGAVIDWVGALFGQEWSVSKGVKGFKDSLIKEFKTSMGLEARVTTEGKEGNGGVVVPEKLTAPAGSLFATNDAANAGAEAAPFGSMAAMQGQGGVGNAEVVAAVNRLATRPIEIKLNISGRDVASSTAGTEADEADRGYADNGPTEQ